MDAQINEWVTQFRASTMCMGGEGCSYESHDAWLQVMWEAVRLMRMSREALRGLVEAAEAVIDKFDDEGECHEHSVAADNLRDKMRAAKEALNG